MDFLSLRRWCWCEYLYYSSEGRSGVRYREVSWIASISFLGLEGLVTYMFDQVGFGQLVGS